MIKISKNLGLMLLSISILVNACKKKEFDKPEPLADPNLTVTTTIADLKSLFIAGAPVLITQNMVIAATVVADDKSGNIYKQIIVDDGTAGISIAIDRSNLYADFPVGRKVYIKCKDLYLDDYSNLVGLYGGVDATGSAIGIASPLVANFIVKGLTGQVVKPIEVEISALNNSFQNRLIKIKDVEFISSDADKPYADAINKSSLNRTVINCAGNQLIARTSGYANFANYKTPKGKGDLIAIYTVFGNTKQLLIRDTSDLKLYGKKCDGTSASDLFLLKEDFSTASTTGDFAQLGWVNYSSAGTKKWQGRTFSNNIYVQFSAFSSNPSNQESSNIGWLVTPKIDITTTAFDTLTFETKDGFSNGALLEVLYSTDYSGSGDPSTANWIALPAVISTGNTTGYASSYTKSGKISLTNITSKIHIAFRYTGGYATSNKSTTFQIDNILVRGVN